MTVKTTKKSRVGQLWVLVYYWWGSGAHYNANGSLENFEKDSILNVGFLGVRVTMFADIKHVKSTTVVN